MEKLMEGKPKVLSLSIFGQILIDQKMARLIEISMIKNVIYLTQKTLRCIGM